jgi:hypothetical protein
MKGVLATAIMSLIFTILQIHILIEYLVPASLGLFFSAIYPLTLSIPNHFGYDILTIHTSRYSICNAIGVFILNGIIGFGI